MNIEIESFEFKGAPTSFEDENGETVTINHTIRGYACRVLSKPIHHVVPIAIGDRIITAPFFKVVSRANWKKIIEEAADGNN